MQVAGRVAGECGGPKHIARALNESELRASACATPRDPARPGQGADRTKPNLAGSVRDG